MFPWKHKRRLQRRRWLANRRPMRDRKSTRLNSSHLVISYAVFCLKEKDDRVGRRRFYASSQCPFVGARGSYNNLIGSPVIRDVPELRETAGRSYTTP